MINRIIIKDIMSLEELSDMVTPSEWSYAENFRSQQRRREWLSWRAVLRSELREAPFGGVCDNFEIAYNSCGAPYIVDTPIYISVSHTRTHVAILLCDSPCAIDMELLNRKFTSISSRYLSHQEMEYIDEKSLPIAWCAKEAAYKFSDDQSLDFVRDVTIESIDHNNYNLTIAIKNHKYRANFMIENNYCVVWLC